VHIVRINLLDIVLSLETIKARKTPHALAGHTVETPTVTLDPSTLASILKTLDFRIKVAHWLLTLLPIDHLDISYENLMANPSLLEDVFRFLGVDLPPESQTPASKFKKLNTASKSDLIANYAEVEQVLRGTRFERFIEG
jgi:hypothetical protein